MSSYAQLVELLRKREFELVTMRRSYHELFHKFSQLENAFAINWKIHRTLEKDVEFHQLKMNATANETKRNLHYKNVKKPATTQISSQSISAHARIEKKRWKEAFLHEKKVAERRKGDYEKSIRKVRDECEMILKNCLEAGEKRFRELTTIYEDSQRKMSMAEENATALQARESLTRARVLEFANLFETLERVKGTKINVLCEYATKGHTPCSVGLRSLVNVDEKTYDVAMENLRQVVRNTNGNDENDSLTYLREQNSVLCQVVKNLKKRDQATVGNGEAGRDLEPPDNNGGHSKIERKEKEEECEKSISNETEKAIEESSFSREPRKEILVEVNADKMQNKDNHEIPNPGVKKCISVETFESHKNGIPYEETTFSLFKGRELRVRHSNDSSMDESTLVVEFVDSEKKFQEAPIDRTVFYLGENVKEIVNFDKPTMHCGVQTRRTRFSEKSVQTVITGSNGFFRINAGLGVLNSEKRAMERSVGNLESTVASLKEKALDEARSMVGHRVGHLGNDFFDCLRRLES